ncbi:MAG: aminotransferase class V-fold PLP-dependent enzyme [Nitriliruptorales bacterium]|nr:aminotransferase class V-fold PLP-dependent enzyme [Nitriliruptorales bacterium]
MSTDAATQTADDDAGRASRGMHDWDVLRRAADHAAEFRAGIEERPVGARWDVERMREAFTTELNDDPIPAAEVLDELVATAEPGLVATPGPRFFGFVIGGSIEASTAADVVAAGWDQCAFNAAQSPAAIGAEQAAAGWLKDLLGIPATASVGFVTGAQEANTVGLASGRHFVLREAGWDVERDGLQGAPRVRIVASEERHATVDRSLRLLGFGTTAIEEVRAGPNGAIDVSDLEHVLAAGGDGPAIVCLQAGNVNTGACDDVAAACEVAHRRGAWVHLDGAFGLWAAASPSTRQLLEGVELADSWGCDGHKWLNVPYDSAYAFCSRPDVHAAAVSYTAAYLTGSGVGDAAGGDLTLSSSRRARGFATWAALRQLGRSGVADLVERCCALARRFADGLAAGGLDVVNEVVLNQVLIAVGDEPTTEQVVARIQQEGTCWLGGTTWRGRRLLRVSVSNWSTTEDDVDRSVEAVLEAVAAVS